jgi:hypothetical protein
VTTTGSGSTPPEPDPADDELLRRLAALRADTAPPPDLTAWVRRSFELRSLESELAALVFDSHDDAVEDDIFGPSADRELATVRRAAPSDERRLMFESGDERLALELTVTTAPGGRRRLEGHILPTGAVTVELRHASAPAAVPVEADPLGGFVVEQMEPGPIRVTCRRAGEKPVSSEWFLVD